MTETTLNIEQEAFLAYMASADKRREMALQSTAAFAAYEKAAEVSSAAFNEYLRMTDLKNIELDKYSAISKASTALADKSMVLHDEWVKVRGY